MLTYKEEGSDGINVAVFKSRGTSLNNYIDVHTGKCVQLMTNHNASHENEGYCNDGIVGLGGECVFEHFIAENDDELFDDYIEDDELKALNNVMSEYSLDPSYYIVTHIDKTTEVSIVFNKDKHINRDDVESKLPTQIRLDDKIIFINAVY